VPALRLILLVAAAAGLSACGGSSKQAAPTTGPGAPAALQAEANSAAAGDIPDNQVFLTFRNRAAGYSIKHPEGWEQHGSGKRVTFRDKNNIVRIVVEQGPPPTKAKKTVYSTESAPNAVTGKRVTLVVDRYYLSHAGKVAIVDLGTPQGVDNVDAYRLMIQSFRWR
jgi:hypothetical protein